METCSPFERRRRWSFQLVRLVHVVQVVKFHIIILTYSTVELLGRGSFQLVRLVQVVQVVKLHKKLLYLGVNGI